MLNEISEFDYLGTAEYFFDVVNLLKTKPRLSDNDLSSYFSNRKYGTYPYIDGGVWLLERVGLIEATKSKVKLTIGSTEYNNASTLATEIATRVLKTLDEDDFLNVLNIDDLTPKAVRLRRLLWELGAVTIDESGVSFTPSYVPYIKETNSGMRQTVSLERLKAQLVAQEERGLQAEEFVLRLEKTRLKGHADIDAVRRISDMNTAAGHDIVSFLDIHSSEPDKFIEVKSYLGKTRFFWTRNEINTAKLKRASYFLYLVDSSRIDETGYMPCIVQNPYISVLQNDNWLVDPQILAVSLIE